jgi:hypothetical protein
LPNYPVPTTGEVGGAACCVRGISSGELSILFVPPCHLPEPPTGLGHVHRGVGVGVLPGASPTPALQPRWILLQVRAPPRPVPSSTADSYLRRIYPSKLTYPRVGAGRRSRRSGGRRGRTARRSSEAGTSSAGARGWGARGTGSSPSLPTCGNPARWSAPRPEGSSPSGFSRFDLVNFVIDYYYFKRWHDDGELDYYEVVLCVCCKGMKAYLNVLCC